MGELMPGLRPQQPEEIVVIRRQRSRLRCRAPVCNEEGVARWTRGAKVDHMVVQNRVFGVG